LGLLTCKNRLPYNLYCVGGDVKHCTIQSNVVVGRELYYVTQYEYVTETNELMCGLNVSQNDTVQCESKKIPSPAVF